MSRINLDVTGDLQRKIHELKRQVSILKRLNAELIASNKELKRRLTEEKT